MPGDPYKDWAKPFLGYKHKVLINENCLNIKRRDNPADNSIIYRVQSGNTIQLGINHPIYVGIPLDKGACISLNNFPTVDDIVSNPLPESQKHRIGTSDCIFYSLTENTEYYIRSWVKYIDDNNNEQIEYTSGISKISTSTGLKNNKVYINGYGSYTQNTANICYNINSAGDSIRTGICYCIKRITPPTVDDFIVESSLSYPEGECIVLSDLLANTEYQVLTFAEDTNGNINYRSNDTSDPIIATPCTFKTKTNPKEKT